MCALVLLINRPRTAPVSLLPTLTVTFVSQAGVLAHSEAELKTTTSQWPLILLVVVSLGSIVTILLMPLRDPKFSSEDISPAGDQPTSKLRSPEDNLTPFQFMTVSWMAPLISIGSKRQLQVEDVWSLGYEFRHRLLHDGFTALQGSVLRRLLVANGMDLLIVISLGILQLCADLAVPVILQRLLQSMEDPLSPRNAAITYAAISLFVRLVSAQAGIFDLWYSRRCYERSRGEMIMMLYAKTLRRQVSSGKEKVEDDDEPGFPPTDVDGASVSTASKILDYFKALCCCFCRRKGKKAPPRPGNAGMGKILNLMRNDAYEISQRFWEAETIITKPLGVVLSVILVWKLIGWPCLLGVLTVLFAQTINAYLARLLIRQETIRRQATDEKFTRTSQFVEAIRHLRWYGWQDHWLGRIMETRNKELHFRIISNLLQVSIHYINTLASNLFPVVAFFAYTKLAGLPLRIDIAFPAIDLFNMLEDNLRDIPNLVTTLVNASVAMRRIEEFMAETDIETADNDDSPLAELAIDNATFAWPSGKDVLHDISLRFPKGLTVIYGEVAAGKTALLQALLGEMDKKSGNFSKPNDMFGYCAQIPWLQSMSIRENILFSAPMEELRYKQTLEACSLITDMAEFKNGDLSNIGENGVGLSGGQKARVALARAVYSRARFVLLDDPFSALDHQTAESIMRRCINGPLLEGRTVILVTHRTDLCHGIAKQWIEVSDGRTRRAEPVANFGTALAQVKSAESVDEEEQKRLEEDKLAAVPDKFIEDEYRAHGGVLASVYWTYIRSGKLKLWGLLFICILFFRSADTIKTWFLKSWGEAYNRIDVIRTQDLFDGLPSPEVNINPWLIGFLILATVSSTANAFIQLCLMVINYMAGKRLFKEALAKVSFATFRFYDTTPVGRLMNRVTSDLQTIDANINRYFRALAQLSTAWLTAVVIIASVTPVFLGFAIVLTATFVLIFFRYLPTSQSLRRLEMVSLTPLMSNFGALVDGLTTVRAFCAQHRFEARVIEVVDDFQKME